MMEAQTLSSVPPPAIACRGLSRTYDLGGQKLRALCDVTFEVSRGEFVAITGPTGSGKSTLANLLGALDKPTSGELLIDGVPVAGMKDDALARLRNQDIGIVFQQFNLLPRMSALENVMLPLAYSPRNSIGNEALARARLEDLGLGDRLDHKPSQLSGGQQQRVAIARALVNNPSIILADEPTGALDTKTSHEIMGLFAGLRAKGFTVIVITHESDIAAYAQRVLRFRDGELIADDRQDPFAGMRQAP